MLDDLDACQDPDLADTPADEAFVVPLGELLWRRIPGDAEHPDTVAVLVALHLATRETEAWTWQTWWWTPDPEDPPAPSSARAAELRPAEVPGAARHYATCTADL